VQISFDPAKSERNERERGLSFERVEAFEFETSIIWVDERFAYPEQRLVAIGWIGDRLHVVCYTVTPDGIRVISLRKANDREVRRYGRETPASAPH
jgi:uncharacterized protein